MTGGTGPAAVLAAALALADQGWPVFPCAPGAKHPITRHGLLDATTDTDQIRRWWSRTPTANLAIPTGPATVDVLDIDRRPTGSGYPAFRVLARAGLLDGYTRVVATPSGGMHVYFPGTSQSCSRLPSRFVDFKAAGGYVLVPPSIVGGAGYTEVRSHDRTGTPLDWQAISALLGPSPNPPSPNRPRPRTTPPPTGRHARSLEVLTTWVSTLPEGRRNNGLFWAACRATEEGHTDLRALVRAAVRSGLSEIEAHRSVASAQRLIARAHAEPRPVAASRARR